MKNEIIPAEIVEQSGTRSRFIKPVAAALVVTAAISVPVYLSQHGKSASGLPNKVECPKNVEPMQSIELEGADATLHFVPTEIGGTCIALVTNPEYFGSDYIVNPPHYMSLVVKKALNGDTFEDSGMYRQFTDAYTASRDECVSVTAVAAPRDFEGTPEDSPVSKFAEVDVNICSTLIDGNYAEWDISSQQAAK